MLRSAIAVASGYVVTILLIVLLQLILGIIFPEAFPQPEYFPSIPWVACILLYHGAASVIGAGVTIATCRGSRIRHIHALALVALFFGLIALAANIDKQPVWFSATQILMVLIGFYVGGHIANKRFPAEASPTESPA